MFTGLVEEKGLTESIQRTADNALLVIRTSRVHEDVAIGDSISVNGCCLTVVAIEGALLSFEAVPETLQKTNLGDLVPGSPVNLERAVTANTRLGGHYVTGHIDGPGVIREIEEHEEWRKLTIEVAPSLALQMAPKGSVAIDGISLTLVDVSDNSFSVVLIPHTLDATTIGKRSVNDQVNIETDLLAKYVERQVRHFHSGTGETK